MMAGRYPFLTRGPAWRRLAVAAVLAACAGPLFAADTRASQFYEDALARQQKRDLAGAIIQLRNALQIDGKMLPAHLLLGKVLLDNSEVAAAEVALNVALSLGVSRAEVVVPLARAIAAQGRLQEVVDGTRFSSADLPAATAVQLLLVQAAAQSDLGNPADALKAIARARAIDPNAVDTWLAEVPVQLRARHFKEALAAADRGVALAPDSPGAHYLRGSILHAQGAAKDALAEYDRTIKSVPDHVEALIARAGLYIDQRRYDDAARDVGVVRKTAPREARAAYLGALLADRKGDVKASRAALADIAAILDPVPMGFLRYRPQILILGGLAHYGLGENEKARPYLEAVTRQQPDSPVAKLLAQIDVAAKNYDRAMVTLDDYLKSHPNDAQALVLLANAQMSKGRPARAAQLMRDAVKLDDAPRLHAFLGMTLIGSGKPADAMAELEQAYRKDPRQVAAAAALAELYLRSHQTAKAIEITEALVKRYPTEAPFQQLLGVAKSEAGDTARARAAYEKAIELNPAFLPAHLSLARLDSRAGKDDAAISRLAGMLARDPKHVDAIIELGQIAVRRGQVDDAARYLEKAADYAPPGNLRPLLLLVELYLRNGRGDAAADAVRRLNLKEPDNLVVLMADARVRLAAKDLAGAQQVLTRASRAAEYDAKAQEQIATLQLAAGDAKGALYSLTKALQGSADYLPAKALLVEVNIRLGDLAQAEARAREVGLQQPRLALGSVLLGDVAMARGQPAAALVAFRRAQQMQPSSTGVQRMFGALARDHQDDAASQLAETWLKSNPRDIQVRRLLADGYARAAKYGAAKAAYEALAALTPGDADVLNNLANVMLRIKDPGALKVAEKALALKPGTPYIIGTVGWAAFQAGQGERALELLREARLRDPGNPATRYFLAATLAGAGRNGEARTELQAALGTGVAFDYAKEAGLLMNTLK